MIDTHAHIQDLENIDKSIMDARTLGVDKMICVGYDIKSVEVLTEDMRAIEVKTSISKQPLTFNRFHLTTNEWKVAEDLGDKYFVYRLAIHEEGYTLFIIRNPVRKYKQDIIKMIPRDGADIIFDDNAGTYEELLCVR